jgi:WD40 repeat protein
MDHTLRLWDLGEGGTTHLLGEHASWILCCAFSPDGRWLLSGAHDNFVKLWDVARRRLTGEYWVGAPVNQLRWHPSGSLFVAGDEEGRSHFLRSEAAGQQAV